jgi:hypothetical protein
MTVASIIGSFLVIIGVLVSIYKIARRLDDAIGVDADGRTLSDRLERVEHQLWENGGDSLADRVNQNGSHAKEMMVEVQFIKEVLLVMLGQSTAAPAPAKRKRAGGAALALQTFDKKDE